MKNEADKRSHQLVILFDPQDGEVLAQVSEYRQENARVRFGLVHVEVMCCGKSWRVSVFYLRGPSKVI